ncbi:MAG: alpha/beta hydrolase [Cytophagales bacterium]|nr:alpha/beta hydrolase [Cytophagales bacterium]
MKIYALSGLGADERAFQNLSLDGEFIPIKWLTPKKNESLKSFALRLGDQIDTAEPFVLLGLSFGGMLASELNKTLTPELTILISSASTKSELPVYFSIVRFLRLYQIVPASLFKPPAWIMNHYFRLKRNPSRGLIKEIMRDSDPKFLKWAIRAIMKWDNEVVPENVFRIHGANDPVLTNRKLPGTITVDKGHLIVFDQAERISEIVNERIGGITKLQKTNKSQ